MRRLLAGHMLAIGGIISIQLVTAALFGLAGYLIRFRKRSGAVLGIILLVLNVSSSIREMVRVHRRSGLSMGLIAACVIAIVLIGRSWSEFSAPTTTQKA